MEISGTLRAKIPNISQGTHKAWVKFMDLQSNAAWYVTEFDGKDLCYGLITGKKTVWGYFSLSELRLIRNASGLPIVQDINWVPQEVKIKGEKP